MREETLHSFAELAALIDENKNENWLYRGVTRFDHPLMPSVGRDSSYGKEPPNFTQTIKYDEGNEKAAFEEFRRKARPLVIHQDLTDLEWLALAQHHGLRTRLLDWTESLLVAAYFATKSGVVNKKNLETREVTPYPPAIYGVKDLQVVKRNVDPFTLKSVCAYHPAHISERIAPQLAAFTIHPNPVEDFSKAEATTVEIVRWKLDISGTIPIKLALDAVGITHASLFPGIDGLAETLNWQLKWGRLRA